ncbi:MAG TPA: beta-galactosidase [Polyangiaceae bacterium]|nr:beta-galactosidase [Polyangiaceae bacterium]
MNPRHLSELLVVLCLASCEPATVTVTPHGSAPPIRKVRLGLCEDYPEESRSLAEVRRDLGVLKAARVDVLRVSMGWDELEPKRDSYDFAFWDAMVDMAVGEFKIQLIPYVAYTPEWNSDGTPTDFWKTPPRETREFGELMGILARRYRGRIHSWELWNEPDNRDYWLGSAADYAQLLEAGATAVHASDPDARVVFGGLAGGVDFLREVFDVHHGGERLDVVNVHSYYETWNPEPLETLPEYLERVAQIIEAHGGRQSLWMAEAGYSDFRGEGLDGARRAKSYEHTPDYQAVMLTKTLALALSHPKVELIAWYELKDARPSDAVIGDAHNRHLGVDFADYTPKPAFSALGFMSQLFRPGFRSIDSELVLLSAPNADLTLRGFLTERAVVLIAWLSTAAGAAAPLRVRLPYAARGAARRFDASGRARGTVPLREVGRGRELELEARPGEVEIVRIGLGGRVALPAN